MSESLVLFDNAFSPYAFKVRATLYEKGIEHEKREMRYATGRSTAPSSLWQSSRW